MKFKKILILLVILSVLASSLVVTCFADSSNGIFFLGDTFTFNDKIVYQHGRDYLFEFNFTFEREGNTISAESIAIEDNGDFDYTITYHRSDGVQDVVYTNGRWVNETAKIVTVDQDVVDFSNTDVFPFDYQTFIYQNTYTGTVKYPVYDTLRELIVKYVFDGKPLYYDQELAVSLVCLVLSLVVIATPLLVIFWLSRWLVTLGRGAL